MSLNDISVEFNHTIHLNIVVFEDYLIRSNWVRIIDEKSWNYWDDFAISEFSVSDDSVSSFTLNERDISFVKSINKVSSETDSFTNIYTALIHLRASVFKISI